MNKKLIFVLIIVVLIIIGGVLYSWWYSQKNIKDGKFPPGNGSSNNLGLKVVDSGKFTKEELKSFTDITPKEALFYSVEQKKEIFNINIFQFSTIDEAKTFLEEDNLTINEQAAKKIQVQKRQIEIEKFSGYIYLSNQEPKGCSLILKGRKIVLTLNTSNTDEDNIKTIIKWFIQNHVKS